MKKPYFLSSLIFIIVILNGCTKQKIDTNQIVNNAIQIHGGELFKSSKISFDFRDKHYTAKRQKGIFEFTREFTDSNGKKIKDILDNNSFVRSINNKVVELTNERKNAFSNSVNSVIYFALLPYGLNDKSVHKELLGEVKVEGKNYYKIKVTFSLDGGGKDFNDVFIYWINKEKYTMDYFAYLYHVNDGGTRFRKAINKRNVNGIIFSDYLNFGNEDLNYNIENYDKDFENGNLKLISEINLKNISIEKL
ncbi:MAG: deoxyribose-phosphate aldolase [Bacteroidetes bacterium]|nr:deoxyribose-phosphate aldolase [Bacteroidota bacterium]